MEIKFLLWSLLVVAAVCLGGCFGSNPEDINAFARPKEATVGAEGYILQPPDEIEISCSRVPEIHLLRQQIRPDGMVTFESLGEVRAAGKTPKELAHELGKKASLLYALDVANPVGVRVVAYESRVYYVAGQVYFPGPKVATGRDTVLMALAQARPTVLAWISNVQVIRPSANKNVRAKIFKVDYAKMRARGDTTKNVLLQEGDMIYVPPTVLAAIALKIEEFVRPIGRAFSTVNIVEGPAGRR